MSNRKSPARVFAEIWDKSWEYDLVVPIKGLIPGIKSDGLLSYGSVSMRDVYLLSIL